MGSLVGVSLEVDRRISASHPSILRIWGHKDYQPPQLLMSIGYSRPTTHMLLPTTTRHASKDTFTNSPPAKETAVWVGAVDTTYKQWKFTPFIRQIDALEQPVYDGGSDTAVPDEVSIKLAECLRDNIHTLLGVTYFDDGCHEHSPQASPTLAYAPQPQAQAAQQSQAQAQPQVVQSEYGFFHSRYS
jgi:hypothetical protein